MEMMVMREEAYGGASGEAPGSGRRQREPGKMQESLDHGFHGRRRKGRVGRFRAGWSESFHCLALGPGMNRAGVYRLSM